MTTLLQAIGDILRPELVDRGTLLLQETATSSTSKPITLHKSGQAFVLRPDRSAGAICPRSDCARSLSAPDRLFPLFRVDVAKIAVMCDYIVFCEDSSRNRLFVLHCELKSKNIDGSRKQIENGKLLADYVVSMAMHHQTIRTKPAIAHRGIVFSPKFDIPKGSLITSRCRYERMVDGFDDLPFARYRSGTDYPLSHFCD
jgi:hypothetical protein